MRITLLVVNYHSAGLTGAAIESARSATREPLEVVVLDNSTSVDEAERLRQLDVDRLIISEANLGYGAGANRGLDECSGETIIVSNPDVLFSHESIDTMVAPLADDRVALTGPAFFWDRGTEWQLPPPETMTFTEQLTRNLARRSRTLAALRGRRLLRRRIGFWRATSPKPARVLSGAVMAFRASDLRRFRFDQQYPLYFEEVDLMRRLQQAGRQILYVPGSRVHHVWAQSSGRNADSAFLFELSSRRYQKRWFGRAGDAVLQWTRARSTYPCEGHELTEPYLDLPERGLFLAEIADSHEFVMAAGRFSTGGRVHLPLEALRLAPLDILCCRVIDLQSGKTIQSWTVRPERWL